MSATAAPRAVLADVLTTRAAADADRLAYDDGNAAVTFGQLADRAAERARGLAALGVTSGDRVALVMSAGVPFTEVFWGLQLLGAAPAALSPATEPAALGRRLALLRPRLVVDDTTVLPVGSAPLPASTTGPEDLAFLQPTSGTSGEPRAACVRHRHVLAFLDSTREAKHFTREDVMVAWVPPWHDLGLVRFLLGAVYFGASCHIVQPSIATIPAWLQTISRVGGTVSGAPDFCYRLAARMVDPATVDLRSLRHTANGGEPPRMSSIEAFESRFGIPGIVLPGYGLAEATLGISAHVPGDVVVADARGNVSNGSILPGLEVRAGRDLAAPEEIRVRGPFVFAGYLDAPEDTAARLQDGWLHTGDSGYLDAEGRLFVLGRRRGMLKRGGAVIAPRELEEAAQRVPEVRVAAAVGLTPDAADGEAIVVVVEAHDHATAGRRIAAAVSCEIAEQAGLAPDRVLVVAPRSIPRTDNGKIRHDRLRAELERAQTAQGE
jgi:fatty-acyl-CoA synthase